MTISLPIKLTVGWPAAGPDRVSAKELHDLANISSGDNHSYEKVLVEQVESRNISRIAGLDQLFRRRTDGFSTINRFTASILKAIKSMKQLRHCEIDLLAFTFLKYAKNYDLFMDPSPTDLHTIQQTVSEWQMKVQALEDFERLGLELEPGNKYIKETYLKLRETISRPSARDEQRTLAILLCSGPSTLEEISMDLGLSYSLNQRVVTVLQISGAIDCRDQGPEPLYLVKEKAIPVVLFLVREVIGLDFMTMVADLLEEV